MAQIALGSNLGDRKAALDQAVTALEQIPGTTVRAVSSYHETAPVGGPAGQAAFLNAAVDVDTTLEPLELLHALQQIENAAGRTRESHWGARTLDLDLLLYGDRVIRTPCHFNRVFGGHSMPELVVPHPRMAVRRFALAPLAEIAPGTRHPLTGRTVSEMLANLDRRPSVLSFDLTSYGTLLPQFEIDALIIRTIIARLEAQAVLCVPKTLRLETAVQPQTIGHDRRRLIMLVGRLCDLRWPLESLGDRWLVTDVWPEAVLEEILRQPVELLGEPLYRMALLARDHVVQPTFIVTPYRPPDRGASVSVLDIESGAPDAIVEEILAACAATRA
jgi:2-amino-4-hydroxy-6-hydroxymethyldihydropteridine diphosphokinase